MIAAAAVIVRPVAARPEAGCEGHVERRARVEALLVGTDLDFDDQIRVAIAFGGIQAAIAQYPDVDRDQLREALLPPPCSCAHLAAAAPNSRASRVPSAIAPDAVWPLPPRLATTMAMPVDSSRRRASFTLAALGLALLGSVFAAGSTAAGSRVADSTVIVRYVGCNSLTVSPSPVPAGSNSVLVYDDDNCKANLSLTGPGVNLTSDLDSTGMGIDHPAGPFGPYTFQAGATYTARDSNLPGGGAVSFTATGSSSGSTSTTSSSGTTGTSTTTTTTSQSSSSSSSTKPKTLGTLVGSITAAGKASLTFGGARVKTLKAGVYRLTVTDHSRKAGLVIQALGYHAMQESGATAVGSSTRNLTVIRGRYFFRATGGPKTYFSVTS